ncbi:MAG: heme-binding protein [Eubacteriales bacterium]|nr:heme-binding protein [Eubacteriales bacterium]
METMKGANAVISCIKGSISLELAKELMQRVEDYAKSKGLACVVAVDDAHGNPIAVHVMEGAFLVSFEVATQKAYTAAAVKMSTLELQKLVQPGGTFYGLESLQGGKIVTFGGGVPLKIGETIVGGLGISGGTGEQDNDVAEYGIKVFRELIGS